MTEKEGGAVQSDESSDDGALLIREILSHLVKHPDAKDTVDGIHKFWLSAKIAHLSIDKVNEALEFLADEKGWLNKKAVGSAAILYGINKVRVEEIQKFLRAW
ncbi:MAG TPA: hypothetical protein VF208_00710 [Candidatus Binatia bacterium]